MGRRDIALHLIENGARMDIFAAAMLGHLDTVRATLEAVPNARKWPGPHGIPLLAHAEAGGPMAAPVVDFLRALEPQCGQNAAQAARAHDLPSAWQGALRAPLPTCLCVVS